MNVSGSRATDDINLDEYERRLRAAGGQQASAEDPLVELARLVESSRFGFSATGMSAQPVAEPAEAGAEPASSIEIEELRPTIDEAQDLIPAASEADRDARQDYEFDAHRSHDANAAEQAGAERPKAWKLKVSALALAGVAMIGAVLALRGGVPGLPKQPPYIAAAQGPTKVAPPSDDTVSALNDAGASLVRDNTQSAHVKVVASEEQPVDLSALASTSAAAAPADASGGTAVKGTVDPPVVVTAPAPSP